MIDHRLRPLIDPLLSEAGRRLAHRGISANQITIAGFLTGLFCIPLLWTGNYGWAASCIVLNRLADGLDGAVARHEGITDLGGYLDIVLDFIFYSAVIFGFALARPENALWAALLIFSFIGTGSSFLGFAIFAARRGLTTSLRGQKSLYYLGGLTEGFETIVCLLLMCLLPDWFPVLAAVFSALCWITTVTRILLARSIL